MNVLEVFPNLKLDEDLKKAYENVDVVRVARVGESNLLRVYMCSKNEVKREDIRAFEMIAEETLFDNKVSLRIELEVLEPSLGTENNQAQSTSTPQTKKYKRKAKGTDEGMIYGKQFDGEPFQISEVLTEMRDVVIKGEIFATELTVTKNETKIFKVALTDKKDSISMKIFLAEGEEDLPDKLNKGMTVLVHGKIEYDNFEGELLMTRVQGIKEIKEEGPKRVDNAKKKRVELHLHTQYSDMDALVDVKELLKQAKNFGHKALAITDHGVVQAFPPALHALEDLEDSAKKKGEEFDFKIIYGMEGYLVDDDEFPICKMDDPDIELNRYSCIPDETPKIPDPAFEEKIAQVKKAKSYHIILLAKNETGRVNLYRLISYAHINYFKKRPRIPRSVLKKYSEGLIIGSACVMGELFDAILRGEDDEKLLKIASFYDYLEIQPLGNNDFLIRNYENNSKGHKVKDVEGLKDLNRKIIELGDKLGKKVVATGDVHFLNPEDSVYRKILLGAQKFEDADFQAPLYFRTTEEMLAEFDYLGEEKAYEVVVENSNLIADQIEKISPVHPDTCPPVIEDSDKLLTEMVYKTAREMYSENLPEIVEERIQRELNSIISNGYAVMYIIAQKLVEKSVSDGYLVGSRGSVGSSLVATFSGITEVNPLKPHYRCGKCLYSDFESPETIEAAGGAGCDMPDKICPVCGEPLIKDGFDIPFETFMGFKGDKEPDIDLNFSGDYQSKAHDYTEVIFGKGHTFRAGTIAALQDKTVYGYVKNYMEKHGRSARKCEVERLMQGCVGVKRSTGQHPGGIVVLPHGKEIYQFTPVQFPANDESKLTVTTHFEYHSIDHNLLKLDILGHDDPTMIRMLEDLTGVNCKTIKLDNPDVLKLFEGTEVLGIKPEDIDGIELGTLGVPEFGTDFVIRMLLDTHPKCFSDLVRISGLSHGTDVWTNNAETLVKEGKATISTAICTRDDIMLYLIKMGVEPSEAFSVMESVRKGKVAKGKEKSWPEWKEDLKAHNVPDWYYWSCERIQYMFPKAHAVAYVMMAFRIAYYKIFYPLAYYAAFFSIRAKAIDYETMCQGKEKLLEEMAKIKRRMEANEASEKDKESFKNMHNVLEMYARGFEFLPIDLYQAKAEKFQIIDGKLMPAFDSIDGMGEKAAKALEEEASKCHFTSREEIKAKAKVSSTVVEKLYSLGICSDLPETSQMSIFDWMN